MERRICPYCNQEKDIEDFVPCYLGDDRRRKQCKECKNKLFYEAVKRDPERVQKVKDWQKAYYKRNIYVTKVKAYRHSDKVKGFENSVTVDDFRNILSLYKECFYCSEENIESLGLDRKDNSIGHSLDNVVLCCEKCNHLLGDIPFEAKILLKEGLQKIRERNLLYNWEIRTKRNKNK